AAPAPAAPAAPAPAAPAPAAPAPAAGFVPEKDIDWICTSGAGGGSDIYTRMIADIMTTEGLVKETFLVNNQKDGGGEVGRLNVSQTKAGKQADHTLLTFNSGDLMPMVKNTANRIENFRPIAVMAVDKQLLFVSDKSSYKSFAEVLAAIKGGKSVVIAGSKGDDLATYEALLAELKLTEKELSYIVNDATSDAITSALGGHVDLVMSKPAAASQYVEAKNLIPVLALSQTRFGGTLADAPTLSEVDPAYKNVEVPVWRGVVGPKNMSDEAVAFWTAAFKTVSESSKWKEGYIAKNMLLSNYMDSAEALTYMTNFQKDYMAKQGIK
ncbi:MAG: tripartite tricarboxylate transporter substrate-binding protein, partial [Angelakisella sp.]